MGGDFEMFPLDGLALHNMGAIEQEKFNIWKEIKCEHIICIEYIIN